VTALGRHRRHTLLLLHGPAVGVRTRRASGSPPTCPRWSALWRAAGLVPLDRLGRATGLVPVDRQQGQALPLTPATLPALTQPGSPTAHSAGRSRSSRSRQVCRQRGPWRVTTKSPRVRGGVV